MPKSVQAYAGNVIIARELFKPVTVDGKWTYEDEWNEEGNTGLADADPEYVHYFKVYEGGSETPTKDGKAIAKLKHDKENNLYALYEFLTDPSISGVGGPWGMGDKGDVGFFRDGYVYYFAVEWKDRKNLEPRAVRYRPTEKEKKEFLNPDDYFSAGSFENISVYGPTQHVIYEWEVFKEFFNGGSQIPIRLGMYDSATDITALWPTSCLGYEVDKYGILMFSSKIVIPEYPLGMSQYSTIAAIATAMGILARKLSSKDKITRREYLSASLL